jgi:DNA-directed RNA polymerase specialized sigma24 family protein
MIDPNEIETRFAIEDGIGFLDSIFTEPTKEMRVQIEVVKEYMEFLPALEADFVDLYFFKKLKQTEIAGLFSVSQPTVHYRLQRATARIQFLLQLPQVEGDSLLTDLTEFLPDPLDVKIMIGMWKSTCQSEVAKGLGVSQGLVRHRFLRTIKKLREAVELGGPQVEPYGLYIRLFEFISSNLNILREVKRTPTPEVSPSISILD